MLKLIIYPLSTFAENVNQNHKKNKFEVCLVAVV